VVSPQFSGQHVTTWGFHSITAEYQYRELSFSAAPNIANSDQNGTEAAAAVHTAALTASGSSGSSKQRTTNSTRAAYASIKTPAGFAEANS